MTNNDGFTYIEQMKQLLNLFSQHRFYAAVCIVGTAVTLAFVMVVVMVYDFRTADIAPETVRSRSLYDDGVQCMRANGTNMMGYRGMGPVAFHAVYDSLPGVDKLTWHGGLTKSVCALPASSDRHSVFLRPVAANWFDFFQYDFLAGRPFSREEYDAARAAFEKSDDEWRSVRSRKDGVIRRFVVISERYARQFFGGVAEAVGQQLLIDFQPVRVVGVVANVSSIFQTAYADVWEPFPLCHEESLYNNVESGGLSGCRHAVLRLADGASADDVRREAERRVERLNTRGMEYVLKDLRLYTHTEYTFFRGGSIDARLVYVLLLVMLLVVPAVGISGLVHAQMQSRWSEIAIRKAYGASNASILWQLFGESLAMTLIGGVLGYALSCIGVMTGSAWLFGSGGVELSGILVEGNLLFRPSLFVMAFTACVVFNVLSTLLPAWIAVHRNISYILVGGE